MLVKHMTKMLRMVMVIGMTDASDNRSSNEEGDHDDVRKSVENEELIFNAQSC